jgi:hypothetical protein
MKPRGDAIAEIRRREGRMTPAATYEARRMLVLGRTDYLVLALVVIDMVIKPSGDDVGVLVVMALILLAGIGYVLTSYRGIEQPAPQPESTGRSAPSLTSVSASSAAGSESRTTPTPA